MMMMTRYHTAEGPEDQDGLSSISVVVAADASVLNSKLSLHGFPIFLWVFLSQLNLSCPIRRILSMADTLETRYLV